jgi:MoaA/NifB/PqqE/SkfB family radical SAM enzyme
MTGFRFDRAPVRVYWELTRACDLACRHCRAEAVPRRAPDELTTAECAGVLQALSTVGAPGPHVIFTGGDSLKRPDLVDLVRHGTELGLAVGVAPSATASLTGEYIRHLKAAGVSAMSLSLDGSIAAHHDGLRGVFGCFGWTLAAAQRIVAAGIPLQINTLVTAATEPYPEDIAPLVARLGATHWSLFFLLPTGRGRTLQPVGPRESELRLRWLAARSAGWRRQHHGGATLPADPHPADAGGRPHRRRDSGQPGRPRVRRPRWQRDHVHRRQRRRQAFRLPAAGGGERPQSGSACSLPRRHPLPHAPRAFHVRGPLRHL